VQEKHIFLGLATTSSRQTFAHADINIIADHLFTLQKVGIFYGTVLCAL
jgi:hypothetical protein